MKKKLLLAAALCLALALSACGQTPPAAGSSGDTPPAASSGTSSGAASSETPPASAPDSDAHAVLVMEVEGQTEEVPATLYEGEGYSIYIPDEGWVKTTGKLPKGAADQWVSDFNPEVTLTVCPDEAAGTWVEGQQKTVVYEQKSEDGEVVFRTWTVYMAYPPEAAEGFGARLPVMAESFAFTPAP